MSDRLKKPSLDVIPAQSLARARVLLTSDQEEVQRTAGPVMQVLRLGDKLFGLPTGGLFATKAIVCGDAFQSLASSL